MKKGVRFGRVIRNGVILAIVFFAVFGLYHIYDDYSQNKLKEETEKIFGICAGDPAVPDVNFRYDHRTKSVCAKAIDDRVGVLCVIKTLEALNEEKFDFNLVGIMAAQEEVGARGACVAANKVKPDLVIVFEGPPADDTFHFGDGAYGALGKGPQLRVIDGGMITNPRLNKYAIETAKKNKIPYQDSQRQRLDKRRRLS